MTKSYEGKQSHKKRWWQPQIFKDKSSFPYLLQHEFPRIYDLLHWICRVVEEVDKCDRPVK